MVIGITGSIGSGKSTVSNYLKSKGYPVLDADEEAGKLLVKGSHVLEIIRENFGEEALNEDGSYNRVYMASLVFANRDELERLNAIVHPLLKDVIREKIKSLQVSGEKMVFFDCPLLYEAGYEDLVEKVWVVYANRDIQLSRITRKRGLSTEEGEKRINSQMSIDEKARRCDRVIENNGSEKELFTLIDNVINMTE